MAIGDIKVMRVPGFSDSTVSTLYYCMKAGETSNANISVCIYMVMYKSTFMKDSTETHPEFM